MAIGFLPSLLAGFSGIGQAVEAAQERQLRERAQQISLQDQMMRRRLQQAQIDDLLGKRADERTTNQLILGGGDIKPVSVGIPTATTGAGSGVRAPYAPFPEPAAPPSFAAPRAPASLGVPATAADTSMGAAGEYGVGQNGVTPQMNPWGAAPDQTLARVQDRIRLASASPAAGVAGEPPRVTEAELLPPGRTMDNPLAVNQPQPGDERFGGRPPAAPAAQPEGETQVAQAQPAQGEAELGLPPTVAEIARQLKARNPGASDTAIIAAANKMYPSVIAQYNAERANRTEQRSVAASERAASAADRTATQAGVSEAFEAQITEDGKTRTELVYTVKGKPGVYSQETGERVTGQVVKAGGVGRAPQNIEVTDADGKVTFKGAARMTAGGFVTSDGKPIETPEGGGVRISGVGAESGKQAQQQMTRIMMGANQVAAATGNLSQMGVGATLGWFGGAQAASPKDLTDGIRRSLGNEMTPEQDQLMSVVTRGLSRGLAILEAAGASQGLVGLSAQMDQNIPRKGDTGLVIAAKLADARQIVDRAMQVIDTVPGISADQKNKIHDIGAEVQRVVPFTVEDVIKLSRKPTDQTIIEFARKAGLVKGEGAAMPTVKNDDDYAKVPAGSQYLAPDGKTYTKGAAEAPQ